MRIFYLGQLNSGSTSFHRRDALQRLGHNIESYDPWTNFSFLLKQKVFDYLNLQTGYLFLQHSVVRELRRFLLLKNIFKYDLIWVNGGELFGKRVLLLLKSFNLPIVLYNNDDPTGFRDKGRFFSLKKALPFYDLVASVRESTCNELLFMGCKNVMRVWMSYDEIIHAPPKPNEVIPPLFRSDIAFIGTWMRHEGRDLLLNNLWEAGLNIKIYGPRWELCSNKFLIAHSWAKGFLENRDYACAIAGSKICIGLLSKGNRDQHTRRSVEIPYAGGLLCAQRTPEHLQLYREDQDAVFWETPEELVYQCKRLLGNEQLRKRIQLSGMARVRQLGVGNETICQSILERAMQCQQER